MAISDGNTRYHINSSTAAKLDKKHRKEHAATDGMLATLQHCRAIAALLTQAAEKIEAEEARRLAGQAFCPQEGSREIRRAAESFEEIKRLWRI